MANQPLSERQRSALRDLVRHAAARAQDEHEIEAAFRAGSEAAEREHRQACDRLQAQFDAALNGADRVREEARTRITGQFETEHRGAAAEYSAAKHKANYLLTTAKEKLEADFKESRWTITTIFDSDKKVAKEQYAATQTKIDTTLAKVDALYQDCFHLLIRWQMADLNPAVSEHAAAGASDPFKTLQQCATTAAASFEGLKSLTLPRLLQGLRFPLLTLVLWMLATAPAFLFDEWYYWVLA